MNITPGNAALTGEDDVAPSSTESLYTVTTSITNLMQAWCALLAREMTLARSSLRLLLIAAVAVPIVALGAWFGLCALLVAIAHQYSDSWVAALTLVLALQLLVMAILLRRASRWWQDLSLPQSRAALLRVIKDMS